MSAGLLHLHNFLRWIVLIAGVVAVVRAHRGLASGGAYARGPGAIFVTSLHLQLILGLGMYFVTSGVVATFLAAPGAGMKDSALRFFGVEHMTMMIAAIVVATIGSARARRAADDAAKNKTARLFFAIALVLLVAGIPWPFRGGGVGRPLFPGMAAPAATTTEPTPPPAVPPPVG